MNNDFIFEFFEKMPRQGPGSEKYTLQALEKIKHRLPVTPNILDIGCGNGTQTFDLLQALPSANITAIDIHPPFLDMVKEKCCKILQPPAKVHAQAMSMAEIDFDPGTFDLIWSEGAIYNVGFERGIQLWQDLLKPDGYMVVSEAVWLKPDLPAPVRDFWESEYPEIGTIADKFSIIEKSGLETVHHFTLPKSVWQDEFYVPMQELINHFRKSQKSNVMNEFLDGMQIEIDMFKSYGEYYSYEFFVMGKR